jgi:multiple antibiotic resistance protein
MLHEFASLAAFSFLALFPILNPPAMAPIFLDMTSALPDEDRHHLAWLIGKYTFMLLFCVLVAGGWLLKIFGISMPVTAGPGSIAVTLTLVPAGSLLNSYTWLKFAADAAGIALAALSVFFFYRYSENLLRRLGRAGAQTISKISAFILLAIGVQIIWDGIRGLLGLS